MSGADNKAEQDSTPRILVVDDEPTVCRTLEMALESEGLTATIAGSGEEGLANLDDGHFDLLIVDKNLPGISGVEFIAKAKAKDPKLSALMITGYASAESAMETLHLGVDGYLEKPFDDIFAVVERIRTVLARRDQDKDRGSHFAKAMALLKHAHTPPEGSDLEPSLEIILAGQSDEEQAWLEPKISKGEDTVHRLRRPAEVLTTLANARVDLAFLDMSILEASSEDLLVKITTHSPETLLVVTAEKPSLQTIMSLIDKRVRAVVEKPLREQSIAEKVDKIIQAARDAKKDVQERRF